RGGRGVDAGAPAVTESSERGLGGGLLARGGKRMGLRVSVVAVSLSLAAAAAFSADRGEAKGTFAGKSVSIDYGRPNLQGRDMLGRAEVGTPWRMGADSPTRLKTAAELTFGPGVVVPAGEYVLTATKTAPDK